MYPFFPFPFMRLIPFLLPQTIKLTILLTADNTPPGNTRVHKGIFNLQYPYHHRRILGLFLKNFLFRNFL